MRNEAEGLPAIEGNRRDANAGSRRTVRGRGDASHDSSILNRGHRRKGRVDCFEGERRGDHCSTGTRSRGREELRLEARWEAVRGAAQIDESIRDRDLKRSRLGDVAVDRGRGDRDSVRARGDAGDLTRLGVDGRDVLVARSPRERRGRNDLVVRILRRRRELDRAAGDEYRRASDADVVERAEGNLARAKVRWGSAIPRRWGGCCEVERIITGVRASIVTTERGCRVA